MHSAAEVGAAEGKHLMDVPPVNYFCNRKRRKEGNKEAGGEAVEVGEKELQPNILIRHFQEIVVFSQEI